jgi:hypothetical protein
MFDYTVLYVIGIVCFVIGLTFLAKYLKKKNIIDSEDLQFAMTTMGLTLQIIDELNLKQESEIKKISSIVLNSLGFAIAIFKDENVVENAYQHAIELCEDYGLEVTPQREMIIRQLIEIAYKNKFWENL